MYGMTLDEFLDYKTYIDIQSDYDYALSKDHEERMKRESKSGK